jgi:DNA polymerase-3 subunit gamma/tau
MLSTSAFNALLKILEEPPKHLIFIFATTEPHKVLPTILSRCLRFDFHRLEIPIIVEQISKIANKEGIDIDEMSLYTIAKKADGSMRDAQSIFDQFVASAGKVIRFDKVKELLHIIDSDYFFKVSNAFVEKEPYIPFQISEELTKNGYDYAEFLSGLLEHFRNIFFVKVAGTPEKLNLPKSMQEKYIAEAQKFNEKDLIRILNLISNVEQQIKYSTMPRIRLELLLSQIIEMPSVVEISELIEEIRQFRNQQAHSTSHQSSAEKKTHTTASKPNSSNSNSDSTAWEQFLEKYNSKLNGLKGFCISNLVEVEIKPNEVILIAKNDFVYENLESKKNAIRQAVKEFFGRNYDFVLIQSEVESRTEPEPLKKENSKIEAVKQTSNNQYSEVEKALKDLFGAREIAQP